MKKSILILLSVSLIFMGCANQRTMVGAKFGVNLADIGGDKADSFDGKTDFHGGLVGNFGICDNWTIEPGLIYSRQGSDYSDSEYSGSYDLDYLNIPVIAQYEVADNFTLEAGPQFGILLSAKDEFSIEGESFEEDVKDNTKSMDFGLNLGAGYMITDNIKLSASYNLGLVNLADGTELDDIGVSWKNNVIQVSLAAFLKITPIKGESKD
ncbi:MAG: PorT family protein [Flavobacteriaceae bacterium]|nr:PorT family protein [Flavobacteriaceae bacterium]